MKLYVDLSVWASPTDAYGQATGELNFPAVPEVGDEVRLLSHTVKVEAVLDRDPSLNIEGRTDPLLSLETLILTSRAEAKAFGEQIERELGLFMWEYE